MRSRKLCRAWACLVLAAFALCSPSAQADSSAELGYTRTQIFSGALRYLRIDLGYEITEKDADAAYLLFRYVPHGRKDLAFGAIEIVETEKLVRLSVKLPELPSYQEALIRDGLVKKLRSDYGREPPPKVAKSDSSQRPKTPEDDAKKPKSPKSKGERLPGVEPD